MKIAIFSHIKVQVLLYFNVHTFIRKLCLLHYIVLVQHSSIHVWNRSLALCRFSYVHNQKEAIWTKIIETFNFTFIYSMSVHIFMGTVQLCKDVSGGQRRHQILRSWSYKHSSATWYWCQKPNSGPLKRSKCYLDSRPSSQCQIWETLWCYIKSSKYALGLFYQ